MPTANKPAAPILTPYYLARNRYGTASPAIVVECPAGTNYRLVMVELHRLAAEIELATVACNGRWLVQIDQEVSERKAQGRVYLELVNGDPRETDLAMGALRSVLGRAL
jgi:hypothetical protein